MGFRNDNMINCVFCGQELPGEAKYCFRCGEKVSKADSSNRPNSFLPRDSVGATSAAKVVIKLNEYFDELHGENNSTMDRMKNAGFASDYEENKFVFESPNAFLFGVIFDQMILAERAWGAPYKLYQRLGNHLHLERIAVMNRETLSGILHQKPALHRFCSKIADWIIKASGILLEKYDGKARNIWIGDNFTASEVISRLLEFPGISQKKAHMTASILVRDFRVPLTGLEIIDVAYDRHIRRVFLRTGLSDRDTMDSVIAAGRKYNPEYPGKLDLPTWYVGRNWCHPKNPLCDACKLHSCCPKLIYKAVSTE